MAWSPKSFVQNITDILLANAPPRIVMGQDPVADPAAFNTQVVDAYGRAYTVPAVAASGAAPAAEHGTVAALLEPKTWEYDTGLDCTFTPGRNGLVVAASDTGAESVTYTPSLSGGGFITVTVDGGVSTDVSLAATWAASDAADVCDVTIASGTFPVGATLAPTELWTDRVITVAADVKLGDNGERMITRCDNDGMSYVLPRLPRTPGAVPTDVQGTPGRLPVDETFSIAAGKYITVHPLQVGVSWVMATAGAAAVSAVGKVVTLTSKNDDTTTVTAMRALIAASASVAALISIPTGTGADTFDHTYVQPDTALWASGTIPAHLQCALYPDGYVWPIEVDSTGGLKSSMSSALSGENGLTGSSGRIWCQVPGTGGTVLTDSGTLYASPCRVIGFIVTTSTAATAEGTFKDGGVGGTTKAGHFFNVIGSVFVPAFGLTVGTDLYFTKGTTWAGTIVAVVDPAV